MRFLAFWAIAPAIAIADPIEWGGNHYELLKVGDGQLGTGIPWDQANHIAHGMYFEGVQGHLAAITSQEENDFLYETFSHNVAYTWIGLRYEGGSFKWVSNESMPYMNWSPGHPGANSSSNNFVVMRGFEHSGQWVNILWHGSNSVDHLIVEYPTRAPFIESSSPIHGFLDARQDRSVSGRTAQGVDSIRLTFNCAVCPVADAETHSQLSTESFTISDTANTPPSVLDVQPVEGLPNTFQVLLSDPITPGAATTIMAHVESGAGVRTVTNSGDRIELRFLPGDVNGDGTTVPSDILSLIDHLNGITTLPIESTDIDRSGISAPSDIIRLIDLLNGVNTTRSWLGASLSGN